MLIRTQTSRFYESFSLDGGKTWTKPGPTPFQAPNAPGGILRLSDGRLVFSWSDLSQYPGEVISPGRQYLHIAISSDDGKTWSRSKLIAQRREGQHPTGSVRYPFPCETADQHLLVKYSRVSQGRQNIELIRIDPNWIAR